MTQYTFYVNGEYKTVDADTEEDAIKAVGIVEGDAYDLVQTDSIDDKCLLSAITDEILFGSQHGHQREPSIKVGEHLLDYLLELEREEKVVLALKTPQEK